MLKVLETFIKRYNADLMWVKGHSKNVYNELVNDMAKSAMRSVA
jgi:ribonuclease HI